MVTIPRGTQVPARWRLLACGLFLMASCSIAAGADEGIVDVHALPQLEGAVEDTSRPDPYRVEYRVPMPQAATLPAVQKLLSDNGWVAYVMPLEEKSTLLKFRKGRQGLSVHFTQAPGRPDQSVVYYTTDRIYGNVPFPEGASDIVFDGTRPYLGCIAPTPLDATSDFYAQPDGRDRLAEAHGAKPPRAGRPVWMRPFPTACARSTRMPIARRAASISRSP